jgi:ABC-2 type transport system ATP-binding protein
MPENTIEASDLTKYYSDFCAVNHINFDVRKGEVFGLLGPNGAGKTTTIRILTGISLPTEGTATIMKYDIQRHPVTAKEQIRIVPDVARALRREE